MADFSYSDPEIDAVLYGIGEIESKGDYSATNPLTKARGKYQFMPNTWDIWSRRMTQEFFGKPYVLDQSNDNQEMVARYKATKLMNYGKNPSQIASIWLSGSPEWSGKVGVNPKYGNSYNAPKYVSDFNNAYGEAKKVMFPKSNEEEWEVMQSDIGDESEWETMPQEKPQVGEKPQVEPKSGDWSGMLKTAGDTGFDLLGLGAGAAAGALTGPAAPYAVPIGAGIGYSAAQRLKEVVGLREPTKTITDALTQPVADVGIGAMLEMGGQVVNRAVIEPSISVLKWMGNVAPNLLKRWLGPIQKSPITGEAPAKILDDMTDLGMNPDLATAGMVTANKATQGAEAALGKMPGGSGTMQDKGQALIGEIKNALNGILSRISKTTPATETELGYAATSGAERSKSAWLNQANNVYGQIERIYGNFKGTTSSTEKVVQDILGLSPGRVALDESSRSTLVRKLPQPIKDILDAGQAGDINYRSLSYNRTQLNKFMEDPLRFTSTTLDQGQLNLLRDAITQDMKATLQSVGGPYQKQLAINRLEKTDAWYSEQKQLHDSMQNFMKSGNAEQIGEKLADPSRFTSIDAQRMKQAYSLSDWRQVASGIMGLMGKAKPGAQNVAGDVFSVNTFLTRWNAMSPETRRVMFGDIENGQLLQSLNKLSNVVGSVKDSAAMTNTSNTAPVGLWMKIFSSVGRSPLLMAGAGGGLGAEVGAGFGIGAAVGVSPYYAAKLMTSPKFVSWLADTGASLTRTAQNPQHVTLSVFRNSLARLGSMRVPSEMRNPIKGFLEGIRDGVPMPATSNDEN
jgi:hypothetical protein